METYKHKIDFLLEAPAEEPQKSPRISFHNHRSANTPFPAISPPSPNTPRTLHPLPTHNTLPQPLPSFVDLSKERQPPPPAPVQFDIQAQKYVPPTSKSAPSGWTTPRPLASTDRRMPKKQPHSTAVPYSRTEDFVNWWLSALRAQTYCSILSKPEGEGGDSKFRCTFSSSCDKIIKGKGNLRRHIEWHLRRVEEETRSNFHRMGDVPTKVPEDVSPHFKMTKEQQSQFVKQKLEFQQQGPNWKPTEQTLQLEQLLARDNADVNFSHIGMKSKFLGA